MKLVYVAGPLSDDDWNGRRQKVNAAMDAGIKLLTLGYAPFIPHLTHFFDLYALSKGISFDYAHYMEWDDEFLKRCDALLFLGPSPGANKERARAEELGIPVFESIDALCKGMAEHAVEALR